MSANTGKLANNIIEQDGTSWESRFQIDAGALTNATRNNFFVEIKGNDVISYAECLYTGTGALTLSEYNNLPIGSRIFAPAIATPSVYLKTTATTFKSQPINT
jgi:hypothetical protein